MKIVAIIQARTSSTRLPSKVLKKLPFNSKTTVLQQVIRRLKKSKLIDEICVATTKFKEDASIVDIAKKEGVFFYRGARENVLSRYYEAAKLNKADIVVRITSDCPCLDPNVLDDTIKAHFKSKADYTSNNLIRTFPRGMDVEVFNFSALEQSFLNAKLDYEKEHVTPYLYARKNTFSINQFKSSKRFQMPDLRITLDTEDDYILICAIYDYLYSKNHFFDLAAIIKLFKDKPWLSLINEKIIQKKITYSLGEELKEAGNLLKNQGLLRAKEILLKFSHKNK